MDVEGWTGKLYEAVASNLTYYQFKCGNNSTKHDFSLHIFYDCMCMRGFKSPACPH